MLTKIVLYFNSIKVQLSLLSFRNLVTLPPFQFHKGTIKPTTGYYQGSDCTYFNSIKVQLSLLIISFLTVVLIFQFHKGTIKPGLSTALAGEQSVFQFHKGTIKPHAIESKAADAHRFQFHKGTIKPVNAATLQPVTKISIP